MTSGTDCARRVRTSPRPRIARIAAPQHLLLALATLVACAPPSNDPPDATTRSHATASEPAPSGAATSLEALPTSPEAMLISLGRPHAAIRLKMAAHELRCDVEYEVTPSTITAHPREGGVKRTAQILTETLRLHVEAPDDPAAPPNFRMRQQDSRGGAREVIAVDGQLFVRFHDRPWTRHAMDGAMWEQWLTDASRCVHDVLQLGARGLTVTSAGRPETGADADLVHFTLGMRDDAPAPIAPVHSRSRPLRGEGPLPDDAMTWRADAITTALSGDLWMDADTGVWRRADVQARFKLRGREDRAPATGVVRVKATLEMPAGDRAIQAPQDATALPLRRRLANEEARLLDGLAGR